MKRFLCLLCAASLIISMAACSPAVKKGPEILSKALELTDFGESLEGQTLTTLGAGVFADYRLVHSDPTKVADMPLDLTAQSRIIGNDTGGLAEFVREAVKTHGFKKEFETPDYEKPSTLESALETLFAATGASDGLEEALSAANGIADAFKPALAEYLSSATEAYAVYREYALKVSDAEYKALQDYYYCVPATSDPAPMATAYNVAGKTNEERFIAAGMLLTDAASKLVVSLKKTSKLTSDGAALIIDTPAGKIILGSENDDVYDSPKAFLLIDIAGNDVYNGRAAASMAKTKPVSVLIDLEGDDIYDSEEEKAPAQGAGILGAGLLFDMAGNDVYKAERASQGFALVGTGILFDAAGNDSYSSKVSSQSCGYYGISVLADIEGNDSYYAYAFAQASAGNRAMSFLVDKIGNDRYFVETFVKEGYKGLRYDLYPHANGNWSQGCGAGNRSVSTRENGLAGGIAGLIDLGGDDDYHGGIWTQGLGYWSGFGFLADIGGNDVYNSHYYSHASVAHFAAAALIDIGGDDRHLVRVEDDYPLGEGAALSFVWDRGVALLVDDGGNDKYDATRYSMATAWSEYDSKGPLKQDQIFAFFIETEGNDAYPATDKDHGWGRGAFFFDLQGEDKYRDNQFGDSLMLENSGGVFYDGDEGGYIAFYTEAKERYGF